MDCFLPKDAISANLLKSIPRKIFHWLIRIGDDPLEGGKFESLTWNFSETGGSLVFDSAPSRITISWFGNVDDITDIRGSDKRFCDITNNLEWFVGLENSIYVQLEKLEKNHEQE